MTSIGFIGIGNMGLPMLANLVTAGHQVHACDVRREAVLAAVERGAMAAGSAAETAGRVDVVITMLPNSPDVELAYLGAGGILEGARRGLTCIDMSTIDPGTTRRVGERLAAAGVALLDAPVSGGVPRAVEGTLAIMVGGDPALAESMRPLLTVMGSNVIYVGPLGSGEVAKICNNLIAGVSMVAVAEAFTIGMQAGVDPKVLHEVIRKSSGNCWALEHNCPVPGLTPKAASNNDFAPGFMTDLMAKDLDLAIDYAARSGTPLFTSGIVRQILGATSSAGFGREDFSAMTKVIRTLAAR